MKVNFVIVGAMKSGTTSLHHLLVSHPALEMATPKEPQFFSNHTDWAEKLEDYHGYFTERTGALYGECSTNYTKYPNVGNLRLAGDIHRYNPGMKIIYMIRHPVERCLSQYMHIYQTGYTDLDLARALRQRPQLMNNSRYFFQIKRFLEHFPREQVLILKFEDFIENQSETLRTVADFLSIDNAFSMEEYEGNTSEGGAFIHKRYMQFFHRNQWIRDYLPTGWIKRTRTLLAALNTNKLSEKPPLSEELQEVILRWTALDIRAMEEEFSLDLSDYYEIRPRHLPSEES